jgi:TPP-dependent trihydroxycyclohexane-1,2-dione (THcHDO) dehydratase
MARSCGVEGVRVDRAGDLGEAIRKGIAANKPYLIDVDIAADINPSGAGVWERWRTTRRQRLDGLKRTASSSTSRSIISAPVRRASSRSAAAAPSLQSFSMRQKKPG